MTVNSMGTVFSALRAARLADIRQQADVTERAYLRSLQWTDEQLAIYDRRVSGIHWRADRVLGLELCCRGTTYGACRRGCPSRPWPRFDSFGLPYPTHYPPMPKVKPPRNDHAG
jgi:hypothetical protein